MVYKDDGLGTSLIPGAPEVCWVGPCSLRYSLYALTRATDGFASAQYY